MRDELQELIDNYNDAVDRFNLARLEYAIAFDGLSVPPVARTMPCHGIERAERHRPATISVQAVRDFFEEIFDGRVVANTRSDAYDSLHGASLELTRRFFQVSLARVGIPHNAILE